MDWKPLQAINQGSRRPRISKADVWELHQMTNTNQYRTDLFFHPLCFGTWSEESRGVNLKVNINLRDGHSCFIGAHYSAAAGIIGVFYKGSLNGRKTPQTHYTEILNTSSVLEKPLDHCHTAKISVRQFSLIQINWKHVSVIWPRTMQANKHTAFSSGMKQWISFSILSN